VLQGKGVVFADYAQPVRVVRSEELLTQNHYRQRQDFVEIASKRRDLMVALSYVLHKCKITAPTPWVPPWLELSVPFASAGGLAATTRD
jgi:hypothetical protein